MTIYVVYLSNLEMIWVWLQASVKFVVKRPTHIVIGLIKNMRRSHFAYMCIRPFVNGSERRAANNRG